VRPALVRGIDQTIFMNVGIGVASAAVSACPTVDFTNAVIPQGRRRSPLFSLDGGIAYPNPGSGHVERNWME
jgi:hypothetical protein